jgi:hypothetical protein
VNDRDHDKHAREQRARFEEWHAKRGRPAPARKAPAAPFPLPSRNVLVSASTGVVARCRTIERATPEVEAHTASFKSEHRVSRKTIWLVDVDESGVAAAALPDTRFTVDGVLYRVAVPPHQHPVLGWKLRLVPEEEG